MLFLFHKLTGTDSLNYFSPRIFQMIGVGDDESLLTTGVYGVVREQGYKPASRFRLCTSLSAAELAVRTLKLDPKLM